MSEQFRITANTLGESNNNHASAEDDCLFEQNGKLIDIPTPQKVLIVFNPISSAGNTETLASELGKSLSEHGITVEVSESAKKMKSYQRIATEIAEYDLLVVIGGDGTVRKLLPILGETNKPVYMVPGGNESLFARSYQMSADPEDLLQAIASGKCLEQFYGVINGEGIRGEKPFFTMASMGFDSLTVKRIGKRKGPINDSTYVWCGLKALATLHHPTVTVSIDGQTVVDRKSGYFIVANSSAYARNLQLVPDASPSKKELTVGFLPGAGRLHELIKSMRMLQHKPAGLPMQYFTGQNVALTLHEPAYPLQVDGDYFRNRDIVAGTTINFSISPKPILVLIKPHLQPA